MMLLEHMGKAEIAARGVPVPRGHVCATPEEAAAAAAELGGPAVAKAQVPAGGRGKAGGVIPVDGPDAAAEAAGQLLGRPLVGHVVRSVLVEERLQIARELFLGLAVDPASAGYLALFSAEGGIDVEEVATQAPGRVRRLWIDPLAGLTAEHAAALFGDLGDELALTPPSAPLRRRAGEGPGVRASLSDILAKLYETFVACDALIAEVNPLAVLSDGRIVAADCRMEVDDDSLFRQRAYGAYREAQMDEREREANQIGVSYVALGGDVGLIASGAGLGMASLDMLGLAGLSPANFLDTGGGITRELMRRAVQLTLYPEGVRGELINLYGGINPMVEAALGIVDALREMPERKPVVVKLLGNRQEEAWSILEAEGVPVVKRVRTEDAARKLAEILTGVVG